MAGGPSSGAGARGAPRLARPGGGGLVRRSGGEVLVEQSDGGGVLSEDPGAAVLAVGDLEAEVAGGVADGGDGEAGPVGQGLEVVGGAHGGGPLSVAVLAPLSLQVASTRCQLGEATRSGPWQDRRHGLALGPVPIYLVDRLTDS